MTGIHHFLSPGGPWASASLLSKDAEVFGFPVGWFDLLSAPPVSARDVIDGWCEQNGVEITGASVSATAPDRLQQLQALGFVCVDFSLGVSLLSTKRRPRTVKAGSVRLADPPDFAGVEAIAGSAFEFGRYHRDARFPRALADRRFALWVRNSLHSPAPGTKCFVLGAPGEPAAFMLAEVTEGRAQWHLGGVSRTASNGLYGPMLFAGVLDALEAEGVRTIWAKVSAANTAVLNIYSALGFQAGRPEFTLHRHLASSSYLEPHPA